MADYSSEFKKILSSYKQIIIVEFYSKHCKSCKKMTPFFEYLAKEYPNYVFLTIDAEKADDLSDKYDITMVPSFKAFRNEKIIDEYVGNSNEELENFINNLSRKTEIKKTK
jgi:thioredoxin 1